MDKKITDLTELTTVASGDLVEIVDVSDTTMSANGTNKGITHDNLVGTATPAEVGVLSGITADVNELNILDGVTKTADEINDLATLTGVEALTDKTLTTPVLASFYQDAAKTKLMTTPNTASDTLTAIAATQTLTNKTLTNPTVTTGTFTSPAITTPTITNPTVRSWEGWVDANETWTYASATTITVPAGATGKYQKGDKVRFQNNDSGTYLYAYIITVANTLLTVVGDTVPNATLTDNYYSKGQTPQGFPQWFAYTPTITVAGGGTAPTYTAAFVNRYHLDGKTCFVHNGWSNLSGGTAGSGTGYLAWTLPIQPDTTVTYPSSTANALGVAMCYEAGGTTINGFLKGIGSGTTVYVQTAAYANIVGNDQSSTERYISADFSYEII